MATDNNKCSECGKWTETGLQMLADRSKSKPIYGTDFTKPLSVLFEEIRDELVHTRGKCSDIIFAHPEWKEKVEMLEGLLTCGIMAMYSRVNDMKEWEMAKAESEKKGPLQGIERP